MVVWESLDILKVGNLLKIWKINVQTQSHSITCKRQYINNLVNLNDDISYESKFNQSFKLYKKS